jgi:hypothetical protein
MYIDTLHTLKFRLIKCHKYVHNIASELKILIQSKKSF